jgi:hypothetical protein
MIKRIRMIGLSLLALGALAFGGATLASAGSTSETPGQESSAPENSASDGDNVQYVDPSERGQTKSATSAVNKKAHRSHARHTKGHRSHATQSAPADTGGETTGEAPETSGEAGSETAGNDGPGGHADEPGNANADHQFNGQE